MGQIRDIIPTLFKVKFTLVYDNLSEEREMSTKDFIAFLKEVVENQDLRPETLQAIKSRSKLRKERKNPPTNLNPALNQA